MSERWSFILCVFHGLILVLFVFLFSFSVYFIQNSNPKSEYKCCTACEDPISDRYLLEVSGHAWHGSCLRCCVCLATLDEQRTCYVRDDQIYCKEDYMKWVCFWLFIRLRDWDVLIPLKVSLVETSISIEINTAHNTNIPTTTTTATAKSYAIPRFTWIFFFSIKKTNYFKIDIFLCSINEISSKSCHAIFMLVECVFVVELFVCLLRCVGLCCSICMFLVFIVRNISSSSPSPSLDSLSVQNVNVKSHQPTGFDVQSNMYSIWHVFHVIHAIANYRPARSLHSYRIKFYAVNIIWRRLKAKPHQVMVSRFISTVSKQTESNSNWENDSDWSFSSLFFEIWNNLRFLRVIVARVVVFVFFFQIADSYFGGDDSSKKKIKRVRTAFTEEQLEVLQRNFEIDSNPDGQDLERIALNAGLSKRVTQVWFQNARARQKKHTHLGKRKGNWNIHIVKGRHSTSLHLHRSILIAWKL